MKLIPIYTEKSTALAKKREYSFYVDPTSTKTEIKNLVEEIFGVKVKRIRTIVSSSRKKKTYLGKVKTVKAKKKAMVLVGEKDKIDLFEAKK